MTKMPRRGIFLSTTRLAALFVLATSLAGASVAQPAPPVFDTIEGRYAGTVRMAVSGSFGSPASAPPASDRQDSRMSQQDLMWRTESALRNHQSLQPVTVDLLILRAQDGWDITIRHSDDQFGMPLPSPIMVSVPTTAALSAAGLAGALPGKWTALAAQTPQALTIYLVEQDAPSTPVQFQISLQAVDRGVALSLWRIDRDGYRAMAWTGWLVQQGS